MSSKVRRLQEKTQNLEETGTRKFDGEDFDSILAGLKPVCTLVPDSEGSEDQDYAVKDREAGAYETCSGGATNGGDGETVPTLGEF